MGEFGSSVHRSGESCHLDVVFSGGVHDFGLLRHRSLLSHQQPPQGKFWPSSFPLLHNQSPPPHLICSQYGCDGSNWKHCLTPGSIGDKL
ncbi:hypothetical protein Pint_25090 [Pistacia integerrima]|uniref:Uncharacterized protein n=1 Tax=Pistacia integerrima TaxID=434235 RepID=A0ACC0YFS8_9ROSI|nr:hypothetical protein Pint_25090 [Pistacia integerrima]